MDGWVLSKCVPEGRARFNFLIDSLGVMKFPVESESVASAASAGF